jgi:hypothetical protein
MLVGLIGLKGSGKDTLVKELEKKYPNVKIVNLKFARGIKRLLEDYFNIHVSVYEHPEFKNRKIKRLGKSPRQLMIQLGSYFRKLNPDCWINYIDNYLEDVSDFYSEDLESNKVIYIFTDVRFKNEIDYLKSKKAILISVERKDIYVKEKQLVKQLGYNFLTRFLISLIGDKSITLDSEWFYFKNKRLVDCHLDNTNLETGLEDLEYLIGLKKEKLNVLSK